MQQESKLTAARRLFRHLPLRALRLYAGLNAAALAWKSSMSHRNREGNREVEDEECAQRFLVSLHGAFKY